MNQSFGFKDVLATFSDDDDDDDDDEGICIDERVINSPQTLCWSAKQVGLQMSSERQRGESCSLQSGW